jgi:flagellar motility protein MotE (MotC chaperone)
MRTFWTAFVFGMFVVGLGSIGFQNLSAQQKDERAPTINDTSQSGIRVPVPGTDEMVTALEQKEKDLEQKEKRLKQLEERLQVEEDRLKIRVSELEQLQNKIEASRSKYKIEDQKVFGRMVKTFETMQPKKAAAVMATLEQEVAVELLMAMKEKKVASVLEAMDPTRASSLNMLIANRRPAGREQAKEENGAVGAQ